MIEKAGPQFSGAWLQGAIAFVTRDAERRQAAIARGQRLVAAGAISHNHLHFHQLAMDAQLRAGDWPGAEGPRPTPLRPIATSPCPWSRFHVARGRLLAAMGRGQGDADSEAQLAELRQEAAQVGYPEALFPAAIVGI